MAENEPGPDTLGQDARITSLDELGEGLDPASLTRAEALEWISSGGRKRP